MTRPTPSLVRGLGALAATAIVVCEVIGTGVFLKARVMTCNVETPVLVISVWILAGLLSLAGALTYAELSAMMPRAGGEYVFIREAYGRMPGFLFGWMRFFIGNGGGLAALATGLAIFLNVLAGGALSAWDLYVPAGRAGILRVDGVQLFAAGVLLVVAAINCAAVAVSGRVASALTLLKVLLVLAIGGSAMWAAGGHLSIFEGSGASGTCEGVAASARGGIAGFGAAMIAAMWAYNGWNELTYVAGEVRDPGRNLPRALVGGIAIVATLYVFVNASYFRVLTAAEIASVAPQSAVAAEVLIRLFGAAATGLMAATLSMSVFSALLVASLVSARVPFAMAEDGLFFAALAKVSPRTRVPVRALIVQSLWAIVLVVSGSFDTLTDYAMFAILLFVGMATASIFVLRRRWPLAARPYRTWGYPVVPALVLAMLAWLLVNTLITAPGQALAGLGLIAVGLPFYWYWSRRAKAPTVTVEAEGA